MPVVKKGRINISNSKTRVGNTLKSVYESNEIEDKMLFENEDQLEEEDTDASDTFIFDEEEDEEDILEEDTSEEEDLEPDEQLEEEDSVTKELYVTSDIKSVKLDFSTIIPAESRSSNKLNMEPGYLTVVNSGKFGYSVSIPKVVHQKLGLIDTVQVGFTKGCVLLGKQIPNQTYNFKLKNKDAKRVIYSASLVREITRHLGLQYGDGNKTCITLHNLAYDETRDNPIAIISR